VSLIAHFPAPGTTDDVSPRRLAAVGHPQVVDPAHPLIERVRRICFELPEVVEVEAWGRPTFRAAKPIFVHVAATAENPFSIVVKTDPEEHLALLEDGRFYGVPYYDRARWVGADLDAPRTDWAFLAELIETSYRQVANRRQLVALDALRPEHAG
jgi:predicted DNA-binding protein (MmcQ/YjbR family)